jgi:tellurite resistance protein
MVAVDEGLLSRVAECLGEVPSYAKDPDAKEHGSILTIAAAAYSSGLKTLGHDEVTQPTGFDPQAAALFEAVVECSFLVANADGEFDDTERGTFEKVVLAACQGNVTEAQIRALLADFGDLLEEDGLDKRLSMVAKTITKQEHAREVLRIAGLLAAVSAGVSAQERGVLERLADLLGADSEALDQALREVDSALASN